MKNGILKTTVALLLAFSLVTGFAACGSNNENEDDSSEKVNSTLETNENDVSENDDGNIFFGSYEQDNDTSNGKEPIEWIVLEEKDGKAFVLSKYALDAEPYNTVQEKTTWESCSLRKWLNEDFYNEAFSDEEKDNIEVTDVKAEANPRHKSNQGNDTQDKIFLLSINEVKTYFDDDEARICSVTAYGKTQGPEGVPVGREYDGACLWWLRTIGIAGIYAGSVYEHGGYNPYGDYVDAGNRCIRPAMWIELG